MTRIKRVLRDATEVAHVWATKPDYDVRSSNCYTRGDTIYSYGSHFPMARHLPDGSVAHTTRHYGATTSGHQWAVRHAVNHLKSIFVRDPVSSPEWNLSPTRGAIDRCLRDAAEARMTVTKEKHRSAAVYMAEQFNLYAKAHKSRLRINAAKLAGVDLKAIKEMMDKQAKALALAQKRKHALKLIEERDHCAVWRAGGAGHFHAPIMLRVSSEGDMIETSSGAEIPVADAVRLWPVIQRCMGGQKDYEVGMELGIFRLTKIRTDGSILVGCHELAFNEIEGIAKTLGLLEPAMV